MMKIILQLFTILLPLNTFCQVDSSKLNRDKQINDSLINRSLTYKIEFDDGRGCNIYKYYKGYYKGDLREGYWITYDSTRNIILEEINYKSGLYDGSLCDYSYNGRLVKQLNFKDGVLYGVSKFYSNRGKLEYVIDFKGVDSYKILYKRNRTKQKVPVIIDKLRLLYHSNL